VKKKAVERKPKEGEDNSDDAGAVGGTSSSPDKGAAVGGKRSADNGPASSPGKVVFPTVITPADYLDSDEEKEAEAATKKAPRQKGPAAAGGGATASGRPACRYGASCYRKNPHHFTKESHPGDADYAAASGGGGGGEEDDSRPECEYGTGCYRKNPDHRRRFKHTRKALPKRRAKVTHFVAVADPYRNHFLLFRIRYNIFDFSLKWSNRLRFLCNFQPS
jgi:hypothetical protein